VTAGRVRVLVHHRPPVDRPYEVEAAYFEAAEELAGAPGLLRLELLGPPDGSGARVLLMDWASQDSYRVWEEDLRRRGHPSPLRPYQDRDREGGHYEIYTLAAEYSAATHRQVASTG
jgi:Antibiotic biosynthesis monooxygenase